MGSHRQYCHLQRLKVSQRLDGVAMIPTHTCKLALLAQSQLQLLHQNPSPYCYCALAGVNAYGFVLRQVDNHAALDGRPSAVAPNSRHEGNVRCMSCFDLRNKERSVSKGDV